MVKKTVKEESQNFKEEKELLKLKDISEKLKHSNRMQELEYKRESEKLFHERELERGRIKRAEMRKMQELKAIHKYHDNKPMY